MKPVTSLAALAMCAVSAVQAQDQIITDRPDFVESSNVVGRGRLQVETSVLLERARSGPLRARTLATPTLLRYGLGESVELRVETDGRVHQRLRVGGERGSGSGYADTALGLKWHVADASASMPSVGVLLHADLDSGSRAFRGQGVRPSLRVVGEWELPRDYSLGVMPGIAIGRDEGGRHRYGIFGVVLGKSFDERLRGFVEVAMPQIARSAHGGTQAVLDLGGAYLLSSDVQLDAMLSRGLNGRTPDWAFTIGISFRL